MNEVDDVVLEFFEELGEVGGRRVALPPSPVKRHVVDELGLVERGPSTFSRRMQKLAEMGLLEISDDTAGYYRITDMGLDYLSGELDAEDIEE